MKRIDKWRVKIKDHVLVSSAYYLILVLTLQCAGKIQGTFYNKEVNQYKEIVEDFSDFLDEKESDDPKLIFDYFNYALWNGYLSSDHDFAFNRDNKTLLSNFGMACIMGKSVCLNNANMLRDLYEAMGYDSTVFNCYYPLDKAKIELFDYQKDIKQASDEKKNDEDGIYLPYVPGPFELIIGNHAITAVYYDGEYYYYDPTNLLYLSKSDLNDLDILNGDGTMKIRKISTFLFELEESFKGLFQTNDADYNLDYLKELGNPSIDEEALEEFYNQEKDKIDNLANSFDKGKSNFLYSFSTIPAVLISFFAFALMLDALNYKNNKNEKILYKLLDDFFLENSIEKFEDVCVYLDYIITSGYLSVTDDDLRVKKSVLFEGAPLATLDSKEYGERLFYKYLLHKFKKVETIRAIDEYGLKKKVYAFKDSDGYKFYCYSSSNLFHTNEYSQLIYNSTYSNMFKLFKKKYSNSPEIKEVIPDFDKMNDFYHENLETVKNIAMSYSYVPRKK